MQLFYHVTRDIELPRPGRRPAGERQPGSCETCGARLAPSPANSASADGPGISVCPACRDRLDRSAIQIHFCDLCGVSVPLDGVQRGSLLTADGRIACGNCRVGAAAGPPGGPTPAATARWGWIVALLVLALAAGAAAAWIGG